jgi:ABC-type uncharacterized transport system YnjBCD ATPase subunit
MLASAFVLFGLIYLSLEVSALSLGATAVFLLAMFRLAPIAKQMSDQVYRIDGELPHLVTVRERLDELEATEEPNDGTLTPPDSVEEVAFEDVSFTYDDGTEVLENTSLSLTRGELVALVGPSGEGKSTLVSLLLRFYDPDDGAVLADGTPIESFDLREWRSRVSVVRQSPFVFDGTLRENVMLGKPSASPEEFERVCERARVDEFVDGFPKGYETQLGDDGVRLSGGQRQRVGVGVQRGRRFVGADSLRRLRPVEHERLGAAVTAASRVRRTAGRRTRGRSRRRRGGAGRVSDPTTTGEIVRGDDTSSLRTVGLSDFWDTSSPALWTVVAAIKAALSDGPPVSPTTDVDWDLVHSIARHHQVTPLVFEGLSTDDAPTSVVEQFREEVQQNTKRNLRLAGELVRILDAFSDANVRAIPYKGPVLASVAYDDVGRRMFHDLDLLVHPEDVLEAGRVLQSHGYRADEEFTTFALLGRETPLLASPVECTFHHESDDTEVELRWDLGSWTNALNVQFEALWRRREQTTLAGRDVPVLSPVDRLVVLSVHGTRHAWQRLQRHADVPASLHARSDLD